MSKVLISGSSGLVARELVSDLKKQDFQVAQLSRRKVLNEYDTFHWDVEKEIVDAKALEGVDHIVHLAGANIGDKRWTKSRKEEIINSRVDSTRLLYKLVEKMKERPKSIISASAVGYYGANTVDHIFTEKDPPSDDFVGKTCQLWENEVLKFESLGVNTIRLRFGVVLSPKGGALKKMLLPAKFGLGSALGSGKQYLPWVHIDDVIRVIIWCLKNGFKKEVYNVCSPQHIRYSSFAKTLSRVIRKPNFMPNVPAFIIKLLYGEMSQIILEGSRVSSLKLNKNGYIFKFPELELALSDFLKD